MNLIRRWAALIATLALAGAPRAQESGAPAPVPLESQTAPERAQSWLNERLPDAIAKGKFLLNVRARYEYADADNLRASHAPTFRTRFGYETAPLHGFKALLEFEDVRIIGNEDNFNQAGLSGPGKTVVADPEATEVNQAWLSYSNWDTVLKGGRQRITLDNHRFVGNVGWRQNEQTFDAVLVENKSLAGTSLLYGYLFNVNRVFGDDHPMGDFDSDSHVIRASYSGFEWGAFTAYSYLLDFDDAPANSSASFGVSFAGGYALEKEAGAKLNYRAEYARQIDYGNQPLDYAADYYNIEFGGEYQRFNAGAGYEVLGSDNGKGFATPLATLHAFNGWADIFLATPAAGLRDAYVWVGANLPYQIPAKIVYHKFDSDAGSTDFGSEWDAVLSKKFGKHWTALAKYAYYDAKGPYVDTQKFWLQVEFNF